MQNYHRKSSSQTFKYIVYRFKDEDLTEFFPCKQDVKLFEALGTSWKENWYLCMREHLIILSIKDTSGTVLGFFGVSKWSEEGNFYPVWLLRGQDYPKTNRNMLNAYKIMLSDLSGELGVLGNYIAQTTENEAFVAHIGATFTGEYVCYNDQKFSKFVFP